VQLGQAAGSFWGGGLREFPLASSNSTSSPLDKREKLVMIEYVWPLLCSGPAVPRKLRTAGFLFSGRQLGRFFRLDSRHLAPRDEACRRAERDDYYYYYTSETDALQALCCSTPRLRVDGRHDKLIVCLCFRLPHMLRCRSTLPGGKVWREEEKKEVHYRGFSPAK